MLDVGWGDLIDYLGDDPRTRAIVIYMESIGDARAFLSAAREVALTKPIIVIKAGRSEAASRAAASHTGAMTGSDEVLDAAFRRSGVLRVTDIGDVFHLAEVLGKQPAPTGPHLTIVTNAGGPAVLATDALIGGGGRLARLGAETLAGLDAVLPAAWSHANPIDILGDAGPERYAKALELAAADPASDGMLAILTPQDMTDPTLTAEALTKHAHIAGKPVIASWMGGAQVAAGNDILNRVGIPTFAFPDEAARTFCHMWRYADNLRRLYETPASRSDGDTDPAAVRAVIEAARKDGRTLLDEHESKAILAAYGIPTVPTRIARDEAEAVAAATRGRLPGRGQALVADDHAQDRRRRRQAGTGRCGGGGGGLPRHRARDRQQGGAAPTSSASPYSPSSSAAATSSSSWAARSIPSSGRCCCSGPGARWSRCCATARWRYRRSMRPSRAA